ncbi:MAG: hypothetical protein ACE5JM_10250 [Armatimonadota bacterium]
MLVTWKIVVKDKCVWRRPRYFLTAACGSGRQGAAEAPAAGQRCGAVLLLLPLGSVGWREHGAAAEV